MVGFYGPNIHVLPVSLYDDPKEGEAHRSAGKYFSIKKELMIIQYLLGDAKQYFKIVNEIIRKTIKKGRSAIVHCYGSLSRSVVFLIAYLIEVEGKYDQIIYYCSLNNELGLSLLEATRFLKSKWDATWFQ